MNTFCKTEKKKKNSKKLNISRSRSSFTLKKF